MIEARSLDVCSLDQSECSDPALVGAKAARLAELKRRGVAVPPGFVLTAPALARGADLGAMVAGGIERLGAPRFAVRTSAVLEDTPTRSFAGLYVTRTRVERADVIAAIGDVWADRGAPVALGYAAEPSPVAVLVQEWVDGPHGVAFTRDPLTGAEDEVVIAAHGAGDEDAAEQWRVRGSAARRGGGAQGAEAIGARDALRVAEVARRVAASFGAPQDIEWVLHDGEVRVVQARPLAPTPDAVRWDVLVGGGFVRNFRLGEWMAGPATPAMETWLLPALARGASAFRRHAVGLPLPDPPFVVVNGWYFSSVNYLPPTTWGVLGMLSGLLRHAVRHPRRASAMFIGRAGKPAEAVYLAYWREGELPRYRAVVARAEQALTVDASPSALVRLVDQVAAAAGDYHGSVSGVIGLAWKSELLLAELCERDLACGHQDLLVGGEGLTWLEAHAVVDLDWSRPTAGELGLRGLEQDVAQRLASEARRRREAAEAMARGRVSGRALRRFSAVLESARRLAPLRAASARELTLGWPVMRRALLTLGAHLFGEARRDEVFYLTREEILSAVDGRPVASGVVDARRRRHEQRARLLPPPAVGTVPAAFDRAVAMAEAFRAPTHHAAGRLRGAPISPGAAFGPARRVRGEADFADFPAGAVLVARAVPPAWLPLVARAAAVVTETGNVLTHSALLARELGVPTVAGINDATSRIADGLLLAVDGSAGTVGLSPLEETSWV